MSKCPFDFTRRNFLALTGGAVAAAGAVGLGAVGAVDLITGRRGMSTRGGAESFYGQHQGGIITPMQSQSFFTAFDVVTDKKSDVVQLLQSWTEASARMTQGKTATPETDKDNDSGEAIGLAPSRLTITFGFGPGLFTKDGKDRYGLASRRPAALVDLPTFTGDQLVPEHTGGDLSVQACADDPQVAFHAVRQLVRLADGIAQIRWTQSGFSSAPDDGGTTRNLQGFKDGSGNIKLNDKAALDKFVWAGHEGPNWMQGGSYMVVRRARIALEHWDRMSTAFQEQTIGRSKFTGAPLGLQHESDTVNLDITDKDGNLIIPENSHIRLATAASNDGAKILRRSYSYNDGVNFTAERWPPWRQGMEYNAGLLFMCYQRDLRTGFIKIFDKMSKFDMLNQFVTHIGGGVFACPGGVLDGQFIGQQLFV